MIKLEITSAIANLEIKYNLLRDKEYELEKKKNNDFHSYLEPHFKLFNILDFNCYLYVSNNYFYIKRKIDENSWDKELITVSAREQWGRDEQVRYIDLSTSFYSTSENSQYELERMIIIGRTAQMLLEKKEDILSNLNQIFNNHDSEISPIRKEMYECERQVKALNEELKNIENTEALNVLKSGVYFENFPILSIRANEVRHIKYLKLIELKGKSAYIEYMNCRGADRVIIERIKLDALKLFIKRNLDDILNKVETKA